MYLLTKKMRVAITLIVLLSIQHNSFGQSGNLVQIDSVTYQQVLDKYYKAIGGKEKFAKIKNKLMKFSSKTVMEVSGNTTKLNSKNIMAFSDDGKALTLIGDKDGLMTKTYWDGNNGSIYMKALNSTTPFDDNLKKVYKNYSKNMLGGFDSSGTDYLPKVSIDSISDKQYYVIQSITEANNSIIKSKMYFDTSTGLLYASIGTGSGTKTETYYLDYRDINGYLTSMHNVIVSDLGQGNKSVISSVYEEYTYNGFLDSYFTDDNAVAEQLIRSVMVSENRHRQGLASLGLSTESTNRSTSVITASNNGTSVGGSSLRDIAYKEILESKKKSSTGTSSSTGGNTVKSSGEKKRVKELQDEYKDFEDLKYRRSSLYTLMVNDPSRERNNVIRNAFGNAELSTKFNDHNIGPYLIPGQGGDKEQIANIETYLNNNGVAKELVAKWFNRDADGNFNMDLIAERGQYNASDLDVKIAQSSIRGAATLKDAGEELIGNTFVIVYDYRYTNKAKQAKKRGGFLKAISTVASFAGADNVATIADGAKIASDVVGKGYFVRTTSYLYRLVWDDETASTFYTQMWVDKESADPAKVKAFDKSNLFKLKYVGSEISRNNLQSTIFTSKSDDQLIEIATTRAVDKNIGKLQRKFEEFRVKTPLISGEPIAAKIGTKEGLEKGDKFEVLEQLVDEDGLTTYTRVGTIKVDARNIWDNAYLASEAEEPKGKATQSIAKKLGMFSAFSKKKKDKKPKKQRRNKKEGKKEKVEKPEYTIFSGKKGKFAAGMLIRQIN